MLSGAAAAAYTRPVKRRRSVVAIATAISFFAHGLPALAQSGKSLFLQGLKRFNKGELKPAEKLLERAVRALPAGPQRAQAFLHLGLARAYLQKYDAARRAFARA